MIATMSTAAPRQGIPLRPDRDAVARDWRRSFIRASTANALSRMQKETGAEEIVRTNWPDDARAAVIARSAMSPMRVGDYPGDVVAELMLLSPDSAAAQLLGLATKVNLSGISSFSFPLSTSFTAAKFCEEGFPISVEQGDGKVVLRSR